MPVFYNFTQSGLTYSFDDVFVPADFFREGNLWVWGPNSFAPSLGTNDATEKFTPVTTFAGGTNWKQVSSGLSMAAIKTDGTLWTWGYNGGAQLGINAAGNRSTPVTTFSGGTNWKQVSAISNFMAAIKTDGTLWTWGFVGSGRLGNATATFGLNASTPVTTFAGGTNWRQVSVGSNFMAAIKTDGTLWTWGRGTYGILGNATTTINNSTPVTTFAGGTNWRQVSAGGQFTAAIKTDGTLWTWGYNLNQRLGINATGDRSTPVTTFAGGTNWKQVSAGSDHAVAIKTDGTLWTWGYGRFGKLGNGVVSNTAASTPITTFAGGTNWKLANAGASFTLAIKTDGTLWTWGARTSGQLGNASTLNDVSTPITTFAGGTSWKESDSRSSVPAVVTYIDPEI